MPCTFHRHRRPPADPAETGCQFSVPEDGLIDFAGGAWCPFHLPVEKDGVASGKRDWDGESVRAFLAAVVAFINMAQADGRPADLTGMVFPNDVSFEAFAGPEKELPAILFDGGHFPGEADFIEVRFAQPASFVDVVFEGDADFIVADFAAAADFSGAVFKAGFDASETRFHGRVAFRDAVFESSALFRETQFSSPPDFAGARFHSPPSFEHTTLPPGTRIDPSLIAKGR